MGSNMYPKHDQGSYPQGGGGMNYPGGQNMFYPNPREPMNPPPMGMGGAVYANTIKVDVQVCELSENDIPRISLLLSVNSN